MAGSYPDVPGYRFAYDVDGSVGANYPVGGGGLSSVSSSSLSMLNRDYRNDGAFLRVPGSWMFVLLFPEVRTVNGYFICGDPGTPSGGRILEVSSDSTNGQDGTWTTGAQPYVGSSNPNNSPTYRSNLNTVNWTSVKAVRFSVYWDIWGVHFYGSIDPTESPDRLRVVDMSDLDIAAQLDFGNIPQRNTSTKQFKVVNNSSTKTASSITISLNTTSDASPSLIGQYEISTDNVAFSNAFNIGTLAPGASSGTLYIRNAVANNAQLGPWAVRIIAHPTSWSQPMANTGDGYAYIYSNIGSGSSNSNDGYSYSYINIGAGSPNSGDGAGYTYENVTLYIINANEGMPPTIN